MLPAGFGGLRIPVLDDLCVTEHEKSELVRQSLTTKIICQTDEAIDTVEEPVKFRTCDILYRESVWRDTRPNSFSCN